MEKSYDCTPQLWSDKSHDKRENQFLELQSNVSIMYLCTIT